MIVQENFLSRKWVCKLWWRFKTDSLCITCSSSSPLPNKFIHLKSSFLSIMLCDLSDVRLVCNNWWALLWVFQSNVQLQIQLFIGSSQHARRVRGGSTAETASCQANMTGDDSYCRSWWIVYYLPAVKQQTSIYSYTHTTNSKSFKQAQSFYVS